ncbi:MAG: GIY-YIG nuclease family protein [Rhizomicrobium sp.]
MPNGYFVYIMASARNGTLYIGMTAALRTRVAQHKEGLIPGFTKTYNVKQLVFLEEFRNVDDAIRYETRLKKYKREWKINLIQERNPEWTDLFENLPY